MHACSDTVAGCSAGCRDSGWAIASRGSSSTEGTVEHTSMVEHVDAVETVGAPSRDKADFCANAMLLELLGLTYEVLVADAMEIERGPGARCGLGRTSQPNPARIVRKAEEGEEGEGPIDIEPALEDLQALCKGYSIHLANVSRPTNEKSVCTAFQLYSTTPSRKSVIMKNVATGMGMVMRISWHTSAMRHR